MPKSAMMEKACRFLVLREKITHSENMLMKLQGYVFFSRLPTLSASLLYLVSSSELGQPTFPNASISSVATFSAESGQYLTY